MNLGTYEDVRRLEAAHTPRQLRAVLLRAQPGWISPRSWSFWRARVSVAGGKAVPETPPRRSFPDAVL
jgi:hypothetical protein